jgi:GNAT superfamily N-acetyltransferase
LNNLKELGLKSILEFNENIETEMRCLHHLQTTGKLKNDFELYFPADDFTIKIISIKDVLVAVNPPDNKQDFFYIRMLYVVPEKRKQNLGKLTIDAFKAFAKTVNYKSIQVEPELDSLNFWKKQGFEFMPNEPNQRMIYYV